MPRSTLNSSPFHEIHRRTYAAYWDVLTPHEYNAAGAPRWQTSAHDSRSLEAATIAARGRRRPGETKRRSTCSGEESTVVRAERPARPPQRQMVFVRCCRSIQSAAADDRRDLQHRQPERCGRSKSWPTESRSASRSCRKAACRDSSTSGIRCRPNWLATNNRS